MAKAIVFAAVELLLLVIPMMFPTIPFEVGTFIWGVALTLFVFAFYWWWSPARSLSHRQKRRLSESLNAIEIPQKISVIPSSGTEESADFAGDIISALKMAGIGASFESYTYGGDPTKKGVSLHINGKPKPWMHTLSSALNDVGVKNEVIANGDTIDSALMFIDVGRPD